ncbi:hypothetical protein ANN_26119 [Periplaneta americana]|uniref:Ionotropic glutamate receptor C-terminal domain-containing protein n=1 Tax=Periplaneta americana TaxID=6978 RepID=A0ABQ8S516_PERAM|nr:hypothetical protein ANN_26119 [Periplaneta americana]
MPWTDYQVPDDLAWGSLMENDSWNGMIGLIVRNEVHIAVSEFTMTALRATVVDFSVPLINTKNCVLILQDSGENNMLWTRFLDVFSFRLWVMVLFANLVMTVFLKMVNRVKLWCAGRIPTESPDAHFAVYVLGMLCMQGVSMKTQFSSQRMLYLIAQLTAVTVYTAYSAVLISFLTIQKAVLPFNSLRELIDIGTYKLGVLANSGQLNAFNTATDPLMKEVYTKLIALEKDTLPPTIEAGMQRICDRPKYAFMTSLDVVLGLLDTITCKLTSVLGASIPESLAMSIQQRSPYRALFNYNLNELFRNGILKELRAKEWPTELPGGSIPWTSVSFKDVYPIVIILGTGTVAATFLLFLEMLIRYSQPGYGLGGPGRPDERNGSEAHSASYKIEYRVFPGVKGGQSVVPTTPPHSSA